MFVRHQSKNTRFVDTYLKFSIFKHLPYLVGISIPLAHPCVRQGLLKVSIGQILNVIQREAPNPSRPKKKTRFGLRLFCIGYNARNLMKRYQKILLSLEHVSPASKMESFWVSLSNFKGGTRYSTFGRIKGCQSNYLHVLTYQDTPP